MCVQAAGERRVKPTPKPDVIQDVEEVGRKCRCLDRVGGPKGNQADPKENSAQEILISSCVELAGRK